MSEENVDDSKTGKVQLFHCHPSLALNSDDKLTTDLQTNHKDSQYDM